jgi:hypothetical protein
MGMDVMGTSPTKKCGEYFRANVWWWSPLWDYCDQVAPEICGQVEHAYSNDGDGLDEHDSKALATVLLKEYKEGNTKKFQDERDAELKALPDLECNYCNGTGKRTWHSDGGKKEKDFGGEPLTADELKIYTKTDVRQCNGCSGKGTRRPWGSDYGFDADFVKQFATFLRYSGGFSIY